jgi:hypothetical protein
MLEAIELNGRRYRKPRRPTVVVCVDGCDPEYLERGIPEGVFPTTQHAASATRPGPLDTGRLAAYYIVNRYIDNG